MHAEDRQTCRAMSVVGIFRLMQSGAVTCALSCSSDTQLQKRLIDKGAN